MVKILKCFLLNICACFVKGFIDTFFFKNDIFYFNWLESNKKKMFSSPGFTLFVGIHYSVVRVEFRGLNT